MPWRIKYKWTCTWEGWSVYGSAFTCMYCQCSTHNCVPHFLLLWLYQIIRYANMLQCLLWSLWWKVSYKYLLQHLALSFERRKESYTPLLRQLYFVIVLVSQVNSGLFAAQQWFTKGLGEFFLSPSRFPPADWRQTSTCLVHSELWEVQTYSVDIQFLQESGKPFRRCAL